MARVLMDGDEPPLVQTDGGSCFYVRHGVPLLRNRVTPVQPKTEAVLNEVSQIGRAAKAWSSLLDEYQRAAWDLLSPLVGNGQPWYVWLWSMLHQIGPLLPPVWPPVLPFAVPLLSNFVCDVAAGVLSFDAACPDDPGDVRLWVAGTWPMSAGAVPPGRASRVIARGLVVPGAVDVSAGYVAKFGRFPVVGSQIGLRVRAGSQIDGNASDMVVVSVEAGGGASSSAWIAPDAVLLLPFASVGVSFYVQFSSEPGASVSVSDEALNWAFIPFGPVVQGVAATAFVQALVGTAFDETAAVVFVNDVTGQELRVNLRGFIV